VAVGALWAFRGQLSSAGWRVSWSGVGIGVVAFGVWLALAGREYLSHDFGPALTALDPAPRLAWIALRLLGSVVVVPLVEELAFRGYLARRLTAAHFASVAPAHGPHQEYKGTDDLPVTSPTAPLRAEKGVVKVPSGPGLGVVFDPAFVRAAQVLSA